MIDEYDKLFPEMIDPTAKPETFESKFLVRDDLSENAFRKYEPFIAKACHGSIIIDPADLGPEEGFKRRINSRSFRVRFLDAMLGYSRYGYASGQIPPDYDITSIHPKLMSDGRVLLENKRPYGKGTGGDFASNRLAAENREVILKLAKDMNDEKQKTGVVKPVHVSYSTLEARDWALSLETDPRFPNLIVAVDRDHPGMLEFSA